MDSTASAVTGREEHERQNQLLERVTDRIDCLQRGNCAQHQMLELMDWMAHFTREHFGFQERLLAECGRQREHLVHRATVHAGFRRQLAQLCIDGMRGDLSVATRLSALCHQILDDARVEQETLSELLNASGKRLRARLDPRRQTLAETAARIG